MTRPHAARNLRAALEPLEHRLLLDADHHDPLDADAYVPPPADNFHEVAVLSSPKTRSASSVVAGTGSTGRQPTGALSGKIAFTVGGHGFTSFTSGWHTQRGENNEM